MFKFIVNIFNSEEHLHHVLQALQNVKSESSEVYCVLDGCTDNSEGVVDLYGFKKIFTPNVRETKAISLALKQLLKDSIESIDKDYFVILQDDVVLKDDKFEAHILEAYKRFPSIGVLGMRHGCNFESDVLTNGKHASETDLVCNEFQPYMGVPTLKEGHITERQIVYKSPICISSEVARELGGYDKRFFPIAHDDTEYCIRASQEGYRNYVLGIELDQPMQWGGTRRFPDTHLDNLQMHIDHMNLIRKLYKGTLEHLAKYPPLLDEIKIW